MVVESIPSLASHAVRRLVTTGLGKPEAKPRGTMMPTRRVRKASRNRVHCGTIGKETSPHVGLGGNWQKRLGYEKLRIRRWAGPPDPRPEKC